MFSLCIDVPKGTSCYPQNIMLQFYICYHKNYYATLMLLKKLCFMKININFRDQVWNRPPAKCWNGLPAKCWIRDFILLHKYHPPNSYRRFCHTLVDWKCKTNNCFSNIMGYHLFRCRIISTTSVVQLVYRCPKRSFMLPPKYHASVLHMLS